MLGFIFHKKRNDVKRMLVGRTNRAQLRDIDGHHGRGPTRTGWTEVVWAVPCRSHAEADYNRAFAAVTRDISSDGIGLIIQNGPVSEPRMIVGLHEGADSRRFLMCTLKHCTPLAQGFYQIGLLADELIEMSPAEEDAIGQAIQGA